MLAIKKACIFIQEAVRLSARNKTLRVPIYRFILIGLFIGLIFLVPITLISVIWGTGFWQMLVVGLLYVILLWVEGIIATVHSSKLIETYNASIFQTQISKVESDEIAERNLNQISLYALLLPGLNLARSKVKKNKHLSLNQGAVSWSLAHYLIRPLIILENLTLSEAINRIKGLIKQNVVRFKPKNIKVASVLNIILILFIVIGIVFGTWIGYRMGNEPFFSFYRKTASIMIGFLISICLALIGMSFYTYVTAIYHTSLYRWTVSLEEAFEFKKPDNEKIPEILAKVLLQ